MPLMIASHVTVRFTPVMSDCRLAKEELPGTSTQNPLDGMPLLSQLA